MVTKTKNYNDSFLRKGFLVTTCIVGSFTIGATSAYAHTIQNDQPAKQQVQPISKATEAEYQKLAELALQQYISGRKTFSLNTPGRDVAITTSEPDKESNLYSYDPSKQEALAVKYIIKMSITEGNNLTYITFFKSEKGQIVDYSEKGSWGTNAADRNKMLNEVAEAIYFVHVQSKEDNSNYTVALPDELLRVSASTDKSDNKTTLKIESYTSNRSFISSENPQVSTYSFMNKKAGSNI